MKTDDIKQLIYQGKMDAAILLLDAYIAEHPADDEAWHP